ncbi:hypothetical protein [Paraburkholderia dipogonis]|uniref:hypothetical protein n=1 Tax=Paraburkholderia dipogonis TaxID=1211383 RepID=UPI003672B821
MLNLMINALEAMSAKEVRERTLFDPVRQVRYRRTLALAWRIPDRVSTPNIWKAYSRHTTKPNGLGDGAADLPLDCGKVTGGQLWVTSNSARATFQFTLPWRKAT